MSKKTNKQANQRTKDFIISMAMIGGFVLAVVVFIGIFSGTPKTMATAESVWSILENNGFEPFDSTEEYKEKWNNGVIKVVSMTDDDVNFNFFVFSDDETADQARGEYISYIRWNRYGVPNIEIGEGARNYIIYTLTANGMYSVDIKVGNTLIFAYSDEENADKIDKIVSEMDYFK